MGLISSQVDFRSSVSHSSIFLALLPDLNMERLKKMNSPGQSSQLVEHSGLSQVSCIESIISDLSLQLISWGSFSQHHYSFAEHHQLFSLAGIFRQLFVPSSLFLLESKLIPGQVCNCFVHCLRTYNSTSIK